MKAYHCDILSSLHEEFGNMKAFFKQFQPVNESNSSNEKRRKSEHLILGVGVAGGFLE